MATGRPPKPKVINDLKGDTHKRRRHKAEPEPPNDRPEFPEHLDGIAKQEWASVTDQLDKMGLLSTADASALEMYAAAYSRYRHAEEMVRKYGEVIISPVNKYPMISPYSTVMNKNLETCRRFLTEFGLTPASRSRCAIQKKDDSNGWGQFFSVVA